MQLPIVSPAPIVSQHAEVFRDLFHDPRQYQHFQNYLTGLMVLEDKSLANISRCTLESADKSNLSRFLSAAPWFPEAVNQRLVAYILSQTVGIRPPERDSDLILDDTLCEHVGSLFDYVERHYNHSEDTYPLAHNLVTSYYRSGAVRFPVNYALYRRYEGVTDWERFVRQQFPSQTMPQTAKERAKLHRQLDQQLRQDPEFERLHQQFRSKITIAGELIKQAIKQGLPFRTLLFDSWYLSPDLVALLAEYEKDWVSLLKSNRNLEVHSFVLKDEQGQAVPLEGPHIQVAELVPLIPTQSYRPIRLNDQTYWCFTFCVRIPSLGKVRLVISFDNPHGIGTYAVLVTNRTDWSAQQVLTKYLWRWPVETFYRDSKQLLGLEDYRVRSLEAMQAHWCLVFVAYSLLHLACLPPPSNRQGKRPAIPNQSIGAICRQQGQALIQALILFAHDRLQQGQSAATVFQELFAKQPPPVMA